MMSYALRERSLPPRVLVDRAQRILGARVVKTQSLAGGYTPQRLARLTLDDGRDVVLKAAPIASDDDVPWAERLDNEIRAYRDWPFLDPWRPSLLGSFTADGWIVLLTAFIERAGSPPPWTGRGLDTVADGLVSMHSTGREWNRGREQMRAPRFFERIAAAPDAGDLPKEWLRAAWRDWFEQIASGAAGALDRVVHEASPALIHYGVRSDNLILAGDRLVLVDWSVARWAAPTIDSVHWAASVEAEGGPSARAVHDRYVARASSIAEWEVDGGIAYVVGWFTCRLVLRDGPPHIQELRRRLLEPALRWAGDRVGVPPPFLASARG
jgi:hypothetical protein